MIPTVGLAELEAYEPETLAVVRRATRDIGLFYLDAGAAAPSSFFANLFDQSRRFFDLPADAKDDIAIARSPHYRGFVGVGEEKTEGQADLKESFEFGKELKPPAVDDPPAYFQMYGDNQWPDPDLLPAFRPTVNEYLVLLDRIGLAVMKGLASTLGQIDTSSHGNELFGEELCLFARLIFYRDPSEFQGQETRLAAHTDSGMVTISMQDSHGLEVRTHEGEWVPVEPPAETFVVFTGELMEFWSRSYYRACVHRVHNKTLTGDRISVISFLIPDLRNVMAPIDPASSPLLAGADLTISPDNPWLSRGADPFQPFLVGEREWDRVHAIFPD